MPGFPVCISLLLWLSFCFPDAALPNELWALIFRLAVGCHDTLTYRSLMLVSKRFRDLALIIPKPAHLPKFYLSPHHIRDLKIKADSRCLNFISYKQLLDVTGPYSGVAITIPPLLQQDHISESTVFTLRHNGFGWFYIIGAQENDPLAMAHCKFFLLALPLSWKICSVWSSSRFHYKVEILKWCACMT